TVALSAQRRGILGDNDKIIAMLSDITVDLRYINGVQAVFLDGEDVSAFIRTPEISMGASAVSAIPKVREFLLDLQRDIAKKNNVIMDGRDIATVVLPDANVKIFLFASPECRAKRRYDELIEKGESVMFEDVLADVNQRDYQDSHREIAPLKPSEDSILLDTSEFNLEESIQAIINIVKENI
ncbi:MAG: (d)CMP kinase, partial [Eubacterium sp.]|nr:(d)CMP kinase [Eubacterium sp.]